MYYIDTDGKTVLRATCSSPDTITLSDGRVLREPEYLNPGRIFASNPDENPNIYKNEQGVYCYKSTRNDGSLNAYTLRITRPVYAQPAKPGEGEHNDKQP